TKLIGNNLRQADLSFARLAGVDLSASEGWNANFTGSDLIDGSFWAADMSSASFARATLYRTDFRQSTLRGAHFDGAYLKDTKFDGADLTDADFSRADFHYINDDQRVELFSQLKHQGARLSPEQLEAASRWENEIVRRPCPGSLRSNPSALSKYWWLHWSRDKAEPAHLQGEVAPFIEALRRILRTKNDFATSTDLVELLLIRGTAEDLRNAREMLVEMHHKLEHRNYVPFDSESSLSDKLKILPRDDQNKVPVRNV